MANAREGTRYILDGLKDVMRNSGLPIGEIAARASMTRQYLHLILTDRTNPTLETIERIFEACGDSFGDWLRANVGERYGRDKAVHDGLQAVLNHRGAMGLMVRTSVESWLSHLRVISTPEDEAKPSATMHKREKAST